VENRQFKNEVELEISQYPSDIGGSIHGYSSSKTKSMVEWKFLFIDRDYGIAQITPIVLTTTFDLSGLIEQIISDIDSDLSSEEDKELILLKSQLNKLRLFEIDEVVCKISHSGESTSSIGLFPYKITLDLQKKVAVLVFSSSAA